MYVPVHAVLCQYHSVYKQTGLHHMAFHKDNHLPKLGEDTSDKQSRGQPAKQSLGLDASANSAGHTSSQCNAASHGMST